MRKILAIFMMVAMMAVMIPLASISAEAQTNRYKKPNIYKRHKNLIDIGIGAGAGALIGALVGGKKGALIGTAAGAGGGLLYTYVINPKTKKRERVYYRQ